MFFFYRLSRARIVSENSFGILTNKFHIFKQPLRVSPEKAVVIVYSTLVIHNWLISKKDATYSNMDDDDTAVVTLIKFADQEDDCTNSTQIQTDLTNFFNNEGSRHWQWSKI